MQLYKILALKLDQLNYYTLLLSFTFITNHIWTISGIIQLDVPDIVQHIIHQSYMDN